MTGVSEATLCSAALRLVAGAKITSLTQGTKNANVAADLYESVRDDLLRGHDWNFGTSRQKLARSSTTPDFEFDYAYVLPSDWLRTVSVHDNDGGFGNIFFREEEVGGQGCVLASVEDLYLRYVYKVTDVNRMPADFRMALITAMARDLAMPIADSNTIADRFEKRADRALLIAKASDARGSAPSRRPLGSWVTARNGGRTRGFE
jgi:hypothetical protein